MLQLKKKTDMMDKWNTVVLATVVTVFAFSLIRYPQQSLEASVRGLNMWWEVVFPSLLPFFIVSELLIGVGVVRLLGVLLEPLMRPLFNVPGVGGFVWAMGMASGYPSGAKLTARLYQEKQLSLIEAERLSTFTNSSNPLFIFGAVSIGFFHNPHLGIIFALSHYIGNVMVGIMMRFHRTGEEKKRPQTKPYTFSVRSAFHALHETRLKNKQPLGKLLGDAVRSSVQTLLMIGGFIILFSVINKLLYLIHATQHIAQLLQYAFSLFQLPKELGIPFISGIFEITIGSQMISQVNEASLLEKAMVTSFILSFGGFSVQAQVASILSEANIRFHPFFVARIFHGMFSAFFTYVLWAPLYVRTHSVSESKGVVPVFLAEQAPLWLHGCFQLLNKYGPLVTLLSLCVYILLLNKKAVWKK